MVRCPRGLREQFAKLSIHESGSVGSNPTLTTSYYAAMVEFGRHRRLKISRLVRPGSSPGGGTILVKINLYHKEISRNYRRDL